MSRLLRSFCIAWILALPSLMIADRAQAIEVKCIEASKYKYLWKLFDDDPKKFAAYLQIDPANLPNPEFCRAALLTGGIDFNGETSKLIDFILANRGWLSTLYLSSGGGSVTQGVELALVVRMFWLKTRANFPKPIAYEPDFVLPPLAGWGPRAAPATPDTSANALIVGPGWPKFTQAIKPLAQPEEGSGTTNCISSCSMIFSAGIDRQGVIRLHRPHNNGAFKDDGLNPNVSLSGTMESLQGSERLQVALYDQMDSGEAFIRTYRTTSANITLPATTTRTPPYVSDLMLKGCKSDAAQLQDIDTQTRSAIGYINWSGEGFVDTERLRLALRTVYERREPVESCVAVLHETERLKRYARICKQKCEQAGVMNLVKEQYRQVAAKATPPKPEPLPAAKPNTAPAQATTQKPAVQKK
jgi:hypothetical protein